MDVFRERGRGGRVNRGDGARTERDWCGLDSKWRLERMTRRENIGVIFHVCSLQYHPRVVLLGRTEASMLAVCGRWMCVSHMVL